MSESAKQGPKRWYGRRGELLVVIQFLLLFGFIFMPIWCPFSQLEQSPVLDPLRWGVLTVCWVIAMAFGGLGSLNLGKHITPLPYPVDDNRLVQHGVYRIVRHPLYSSQLFAAFGWVVYTLSLSHLFVLILGFLFFDYKAAREEEWLQARHPDYADYARRVRKFIPWLY